MVASVRAAIPRFTNQEHLQNMETALEMQFQKYHGSTKLEVLPLEIYKHRDPFGKNVPAEGMTGRVFGQAGGLGRELTQEDLAAIGDSSEGAGGGCGLQGGSHGGSGMQNSMQSNTTNDLCGGARGKWYAARNPRKAPYTQVVPLPEVAVSATKPARKTMRNFRMARKLLQDKLFLSVRERKMVDGIESSPLVSYLKYYHPIGARRRLDVLKENNFHVGFCSKSICNYTKEYADVYVLQQPYKNIPLHALRFAVNALSSDPNSVMEMPNDDVDHDLEQFHIAMGISGGGYNRSGSTGQDRAGVEDNNNSAKTATSKLPSDFPPYMEGTEQMSAFHLYIPLKWVKEKKEDYKARKEANEDTTEYEGIKFELIDDAIWDQIEAEGFKDNYLNLGYFYFARSKWMTEVDRTDPFKRTYGRIILGQSGADSEWAKMENNQVMTAKPLFHGGLRRNGYHVCEPAVAPDWVKRQDEKKEILKKSTFLTEMTFEKGETCRVECTHADAKDWSPSESLLMETYYERKKREMDEERLAADDEQEEEMAGGEEHNKKIATAKHEEKMAATEQDEEMVADDHEGKKCTIGDIIFNIVFNSDLIYISQMCMMSTLTMTRS
ncbi:MAG: hypothetical protein SGARI_000240 [Bacillariaceae sp.]